jgi:hypothetical protein
LIREPDGQNAVLAEQRRRLMDHTAWGRARAGIRDRWNR